MSGQCSGRLDPTRIQLSNATVTGSINLAKVTQQYTWTIGFFQKASNTKKSVKFGVMAVTRMSPVIKPDAVCDTGDEWVTG